MRFTHIDSSYLRFGGLPKAPAQAITCLLLAIAVTGPTSLASGADKGVTARQADDPRSFRSVLRQIAERDRIAIIAEGYPALELPENVLLQFPDIPTADADIAVAAAAYDYDFEQLSSHLYILKKRYSNLIDTPDVTRAEAVQTAEAIQRLIRPFIAAAKDRSLP